MAIVEAEQTTRKTLRGGVEPYKLSDEERALGRQIALQKRREAKRQYEIEQLIPKAWRVQNRHLSRRDVPPAVAQRASEFVWEQVHGKAVARGELVIQAQAPWEQWTQEQRAYVLATLEARRALPVAGDTGVDP